MTLGTLANAAITHALWRRGRRAFQIGTFPDVLPKTREDILPAIALAISAGISEELFFRLFLPLLIALVSGSALAGTIIAALCFGGVHRYQGWRGVVATTLSGVALSVLYGLTNSVWMAIAFHIAIDINALVVRPMARGAWRA
nr:MULTISPECIES: CPBP family intramembrane glutamic endopeptidase [Sphingomonas]